MEVAKEDNYYIELSKAPIRFEAVNHATSVFFDDANRQVFTVRSGGTAGVVVKGPDTSMNKTFRMEDRGDVISIKFSSDMKILAIQRSKTSVEFMNYQEKLDDREYSQSCKGKSTQILGFLWTSPSEVVFVTDQGIEFYQVFPEKRSLKAIKNFAVPVNWFIWLAERKMLLLSSGVLGNIINPFTFRAGGTIQKQTKFEVELSSAQRATMKLCLQSSDVTLAILYGQLYVVVMRHQSSHNPSSGGAEVVLYKLLRDSASRKTHVLRVDMSGCFAVNVVDNLILVHHQASKTSLMYDIRLEGKVDHGVTYHYPFVPPLPIKPVRLPSPAAPVAAATQEADPEVELYSKTWIVFQPNIIIDAKLGYLWQLQLRLSPLLGMISDKCILMDILLQRAESKSSVLRVCQQMLEPEHQCELATIATVFDKLNYVYFDYLQREMNQLATESPEKDIYLRRPETIIDQSELYSHVFRSFEEDESINYKFLVAVLVEYIRSLNQFGIAVQHYLYELVINQLVKHNRFYQLHQFLQYHVLSDSKPLACLMLSLEATYAPAHQLALDMLKRLQTADDEITEVLLSKKQIITALRFVKSVGKVDTISARKYLEAAKHCGDKDVFYSVFRFFEQRNVRLRGDAKFAKGEHCEPYVKHFQDLFGS